MKKAGIPFILFILCLSFSGGCTKKSKQKEEAGIENKNFNEEVAQTAYKGTPVKNDWMVLHLPSHPDNLNPIVSTDLYSQEIREFVFDTLVAYDPQTGDPVGRAAERWEVSKDGLQYDFYLRKGMKFHDGKPVTANDLVFTIDKIKDPKVDAAHMQNYFKDLKKWEKVDDYHVRLTMAEPYFRNLITLGLIQIIPQHIYGKGDFNKNPANRKPVGSGPYKLAKWDTSGNTITLDRFTDWHGLNDDYWKNRYNFEKILARVITDENVSVISFKKGDIDVLEPTADSFKDEFDDPELLKKIYKLNYSTDDGRGYSYIGWNLRLPMFEDKRVRQALAHAMPREEINKKIYGNLRKPAVGPFPGDSPKMDPDINPREYNPEKAKSLLAEAGWKDTDGDGLLDKDGKPFKFELKTTTNEIAERLALIYRQALKGIGIEMEIRTMEWTVFLKQIKDDKFEACMLGWGSSLDSDPYQIWHSSQIGGGGSNRIAFNNKRVDELLETARKTLDREKRNKLFHEFTRILHEEAPYLFSFESRYLYVVNGRFQNVLPIGKLGMDQRLWFTPPGQEKYARN